MLSYCCGEELVADKITRGRIIAGILVTFMVLFAISGDADETEAVRSSSGTPAVTVSQPLSAPVVPAPVVPAPVELVTKDEMRTRTAPYCADQWPDDLSLRAACGRNAAEGMAAFNTIAKRYTDQPDMRRALEGCRQQWVNEASADYSLLGACARNQEQGLREMLR